MNIFFKTHHTHSLTLLLYALCVFSNLRPTCRWCTHSTLRHDQTLCMLWVLLRWGSQSHACVLVSNASATFGCSKPRCSAPPPHLGGHFRCCPLDRILYLCFRCGCVKVILAFFNGHNWLLQAFLHVHSRLYSTL